MKIKIPFFVFLILFAACSTDKEENLNLAPGTFEVSVIEITDRSASISWTKAIDPEGQSENYTIILNDEELLRNTNTRSYAFTDLDSDRNYLGKVIASDGTNSTIAEFSFTTEEFIPKIYNGHVLLTNQAEVNSFGAEKYNIVNGSFGIESRYGPTTNITDLTPLGDLMEVKEDLRIRDSSLETLRGLNNLSEVGKNFEISYNSKLQNFEGVERLHTISGNLGIHTNPQITNLGPLEAVVSIGEIYVSGNEKLKTIRLLPVALSVNHIYFSDNPSLEIIEGFEKVQKIIYDLEITNNPKLTVIPKFEDLLSVNYGVYISKNGKVENLYFPKLNSVTYNIEVMANPMLMKLNGFSNLRFVGRDFFIWNNPQLINFCNLSPLINEGEIGRSLIISGNGYNPTYKNIEDGNCTPG